MDKKLLIILVTFPIVSIFLTLIVLNIEEIEKTQMDFPGNNSQKSVADSFINYADIINYSESGKPKNNIVADKILHYPGKVDSKLIKPNISLFRELGAPILITADNGFTNPQGTRIILTGHVVITRERSPHNQFFQLKSPTLTIWPNKEYAETDQAVLMTTEDTIVNAIGMKAYIDVEHYLLLSNVKTKHQPVKR